MFLRRAAVLLPMIAIVLAACTPAASGGSTAPGASTAASAAAYDYSKCIVGVSWNNFQQPRWAAKDEPNMKKVIEAAGAKYISKDANLVTLQQATDVTTLIQQGATVLILLAQDGTAILKSVTEAHDAGIPVIAYDRLIESPDVLYLTFDNVLVGKAEATAILAKVPKGNYVIIKGDPGDANAKTFLRGGYDDAGLKAAVDKGDIKIFDEQFTTAWATQTAQTNMEAIIDHANAAGVKIDAVLAENDSTALGVVAALKAKSYASIPVSGQDGDDANLNNVAKGLQYVDVLKDANELGKVAGEAALQLCAGTAMGEISTPADLLAAVAPAAGNKATDFKTPGGVTVKSIILTPTPITAETLDQIPAGWITKDKLCAGVDAAKAPAACK